MYIRGYYWGIRMGFKKHNKNLCVLCVFSFSSVFSVVKFVFLGFRGFVCFVVGKCEYLVKFLPLTSTVQNIKTKFMNL